MVPSPRLLPTLRLGQRRRRLKIRIFDLTSYPIVNTPYFLVFTSFCQFLLRYRRNVYKLPRIFFYSYRTFLYFFFVMSICKFMGLVKLIISVAFVPENFTPLGEL